MNNIIFLKIFSLAHQSIVFDEIVIFITNPLIYIMIIFISIYFLFDIKDFVRKIDSTFILEKVRNFIPVFITGFLAWGIGDLIKIIVREDRPFVSLSQVIPLVSESGFSFPSLHATLITALAFAVYFKNKSFGYVCLVIAFMIGLSRIVVGVHYPIDVLSGFILGFFVAFLVHKISHQFPTSRTGGNRIYII